MGGHGRILIGTSSWTDPTLIKEADFYPPGANTPEKRLRFYATRFPLVEVDSSYYYPPSEANSVRWVERTPDDFTFNIKAYSLLTNHPTRPDSLFADIRESLPPIRKRFVYRDQLPQEAVDEVWQRFHDAIWPLHEAGKLGAVLFQFPQWFVRNRESRGYIQECKARLADYRVAVEFRHRSWMAPEHVEDTLGFLEELELPYVCVDMPQGFESSVPPVAAATTPDLAMVQVPRPQRRGLGGAERDRLEPVRLRLPRRRAEGVGPEDRGTRRAGARDARADEQLLPRLRGAQRAGAGRAPGRRPR